LTIGSKPLSVRDDSAGLTRPLVGILPATAAAARPRLLAALEQVFPVRFEGRNGDEIDGLDGAILFGDESAAAELVRRRRIPCLSFAETGSVATAAPLGSVELSAGRHVDRRLRGRRFERSEITALPLAATPRPEDVFATSSGRPIWIRRAADGAGAYASALAPPELQAGESIRDLLRPARFMPLLPLVHFFRELTAERQWAAPSLRASIIIDDPNLHWPSYGYVAFEQLARHARVHRHHVAMAIIPLDLWYADRRAVRSFREHSAELSLVVHGNDHVRSELTQARSEDEALELLTKALTRVVAFERRTGLEIGRVMVPPHGDCNDVMFDALARMGFDAISWSPKPRTETSGWCVADVAPGGLPSIPRSLLVDRDDVPFRAYLNQPLVLEGHHNDLASGLELLEEAADDVNGLGDVSWSSPSDIARTNFEAFRLDDSLRIRTFSRRVALTIPDGVERLIVEVPPYELQHDERVVVHHSGSGTSPVSAALFEEVSVSPGAVEVRLMRSRFESGRLTTTPGSPWPYVRRLLTESRDRTVPLTDALGRALR
jgi:hypothetical protein